MNSTAVAETPLSTAQCSEDLSEEIQPSTGNGRGVTLTNPMSLLRRGVKLSLAVVGTLILPSALNVEVKRFNRARETAGFSFVTKTLGPGG